MYPKTYATITKRRYPKWIYGGCPDWPELTVVTESGVEMDLPMAWKQSRSSSVKFVEGVRIKLYKRPNRNHPEFRKIGD